MGDRTITITHNGVTYTGEIATISSTSLGWEDHGILTTNLGLSWDGGGVGFGGYVLDRPAKGDRSEAWPGGRLGTAYCSDFLIQTMQTIGVDKWEDLKGASVIALFEGASRIGSRIRGIAGLSNNRVFVPAEHAQLWRTEEATHG